MPVLAALLAFLCALAAAPTAAIARTPRTGGSGSGGSGLGAGGPAGPASNPAADVVRLSGVVDASGDGITLTVAASGTQGHPLTITGVAPTSDAGATIAVESARTGGVKWSTVATATVAANGSFSVQWTPAASAQMDLRAVLASEIVPAGSSSSTGASGGGGLPAGGSASTASSPIETAPLSIPIFRNAVATIYGPGFWGHHTACGERLTRSTLGVASRTLPCGTRVGVLYRGREIIVPVIDRGPFARGVTWDLTMATARALGVRETVTVGTLAPAPAVTPHS